MGSDFNHHFDQIPCHPHTQTEVKGLQSCCSLRIAWEDFYTGAGCPSPAYSNFHVNVVGKGSVSVPFKGSLINTVY